MKQLKSIFPIALLGFIFMVMSFTAPFNKTPIAKLGSSTGGLITADNFKSHKTLVLENVTENCSIESFNIIKVSRRQDPIEVKNVDAEFSPSTLSLIKAARPSDIFYFDQVMVRCEGETESSKVNSLIFKLE